MKKFVYSFVCLILILTSCQESEDEPAPTPSIRLDAFTDISFTSVKVKGFISESGNGIWGICWSDKNQTPTIDDSSQEYGRIGNNQSVENEITNLENNQTYYVRLFVRVNTETYYSSPKSFMTLGKLPSITTPTVTQTEVYDIYTSFDIVSVGASKVTSYGVCWSKDNPEPTIYNDKIDVTKHNGDTEAPISGVWVALGSEERLEHGTKYYVRSFARNKEGIVYSDVVEASTKVFETPTFASISPIRIDYQSALLEVMITDMGNNPERLYEHGFCWSETNTEPTIEDEVFDRGFFYNSIFSDNYTETPVFQSEIENLKPNTTYYVRAYGKNEGGYSYSETLTITTTDNIGTASWYLANEQRRTEWWNNLSSEWKKKFNQHIDYSKGELEDKLPDSEIVKLFELTELSLFGHNLNDLTGLQHFTNLQSLNLRTFDNINDLTPIQNLTQLKIFSIDQTQISDITPLKSLSRLERLIISNSQVSNLEPLAELSKLGYIYLPHNQITDLTPLRSLRDLRSLFVGHNPVSSLDGIENLSQLNDLDVSYTSITDFSSLKNFKDRFYPSLRLNGNNLTSLDFLKEVTNIQSLYINDNQIMNIDLLKTMESLNYFEANNNQISDVEPLRELELHSLALNGNQIKNVEPLGKLSKLYSLDIRNNGLTSLSGLEGGGLPSLQTFYALEGNTLSAAEIRLYQLSLGVTIE